MPVSQRTIDLLRHLASRPGHDEVKADFRQLLVEDFGVELSALEFERRVPEVRGRLDALIGRTVFLGKTYVTFDRLRRDRRDTIWAYVARNLSRPLAYSANGGWAHVVIGNPPWLAFRHMNADLQKRFRELAKAEKVCVGGKFVTQNDLCALFTVRATHLYLRPGGWIAFVLPMATLTRGQFERLRTGSFNSVRISWDEPWTMDDSVFPLFPVPSCAVFGGKRAASQPLPDTVRAYSGFLPFRDATEDVADARLQVTEGAPALAAARDEGGSKYRSAFRNGATLFPRLLGARPSNRW